MGLGLSICNEFLKQMSNLFILLGQVGKFLINSKEKHGTKVQFFLDKEEDANGPIDIKMIE